MAELPETYPPLYAIRLRPGAYQEVIEASVRVAEITGERRLGTEWVAGFQEAITVLATQPRRFPVVPAVSQYVKQEVRRLLYRRSAASNAAYHVYFIIEEDGDEGPQATIFHVRHAARKPMTRKDALELSREP